MDELLSIEPHPDEQKEMTAEEEKTTDVFEKSKEILAPGGTMIFYSNEEGIVKKQLRLHTEYRLIQEFVISEKRHFSLYIVGIKG